MKRRRFMIALGAAAATPVLTRADESAMLVIGFLAGGRSVDSQEQIAAYRAGLAQSGFVEGRNVAIEFRWAEGQYERLPALAADLVRRPVSVIVAIGGAQTVRAAKAATATIPIVFLVGSDPIRLGVVASLNQPGGNATGVTLFSSVVLAKRLALLREVAPKVAVVAVLVNPSSANAKSDAEDLQTAALSLGLTLDFFPVAAETDVDAAFAKLDEHRADALLVGPDPFIDSQRRRIVGLAARSRVPAIYAWREFVDVGGLMSYGSRINDAERDVAGYTGRILRGAKPAELPVLQPTRFELIVNLNAAKALGLDIPPNLLARADEVIE